MARGGDRPLLNLRRLSRIMGIPRSHGQIHPTNGKIQSTDAMHMDKSSTDWIKQPLTSRQHTQTSTAWVKTDAEKDIRRPKYPANGKIRSLTSRLKNQIIQSMEGNGRSASPYMTKTPSHWIKTPAYRPATQPKHPANGQYGR